LLTNEEIVSQKKVIVVLLGPHWQKVQLPVLSHGVTIPSSDGSLQNPVVEPSKQQTFAVFQFVVKLLLGFWIFLLAPRSFSLPPLLGKFFAPRWAIPNICSEKHNKQ
jgi:hypothetical protein